MNDMAGSMRIRVMALAAACVAVLVGYLIWIQPSDGSADWKTVEFRGVRVEIPAQWEASKLKDCSQGRWGPADAVTCDGTDGVEFVGSNSDLYGSASDGVRKDNTYARPHWTGVADVSDLHVIAFSFDRDVVDRVLNSVRK